MTIECVCPSCGTVHDAADNEIGRAYVCARCKNECIVPSLRVDPGRRFGRFEVMRPIGCGASSEVHLARHVDSGQQAALKILFVEDADAETDKRRFGREVRNASSLRHPNLVEIYEFGEAPPPAGQRSSICYLAMEYIEGETLDKFLEDHGELPEDDGLRVVLDVARAMAFAWNEKHIVHRDIKPGNIILSLAGQTKLMDLGIAKSLLFDHTLLTAPDTVIGSPPYMSPEQCAPGKQIDHRADIYSLGATLYQLVTNNFPFLGKNAVETLRMQMFAPLPDPRKHCPKLSDGMVTLIRKMMAKSVNQRQQTWEQLIADATAVLEPLKAARRV